MVKGKKEMHKLKKIVLEKAKIKDGTSADNIKLGNMGSWAMLFGNCQWDIPELGITIQGTCGKHCKGCFNPSDPKKSPCYVAKSYIKYTNRNEDDSIGDITKNKCSVKLGHAYRTIAMTMFRKELLVSLDMQLTMKRKKFKIIRINESGELTCIDDLRMWCELSRRHPETTFYFYTKNYKAVKQAIEENIICENLFVNISVWHKYGINEYLEMKEHKQIRAFVLLDNEWTIDKYLSKGIEVTSTCGAYDVNGKMNHEVTCDKCRKCYSKKNKVVGCFEH